MKAIVEISENGTIQLPRELLAQVRRGTPYWVQAEEAKLTLTPVTQTGQLGTGVAAVKQETPFWATATTAERIAAFQRWVDSHKSGPGLPLAALRRESIYE
ncbi:MAG: hypothetical protein HZA90_20285 [Verrucomicrobia bacterium]|nr:hypothetical protein [Verrucomicrobiota bacterium]